MYVPKIKVGEVVCELFFDSLYSAQPSGFAIQVWDDCFLSNSQDTIDNYFNHGCDLGV